MGFLAGFRAVIIKVKNKADYGIAQVPGLASFGKVPVSRMGFTGKVFASSAKGYQMTKNIRVLVVGCGHMGRSHARAYHKLDGFEVVGLVSRGDGSREKLAAQLGGKIAQFGDFDT